MNQVGTIKRIDQYERVYVPKQILEALGLEKSTEEKHGGHCVWVETDMGYMLKKANVDIEE
jgi:hypothetical protein